MAGERRRAESINAKRFSSVGCSWVTSAMDSSMVAQGGISAGILVAFAVLYKVYTVVNHHRIRGKCCGKVWDASLDIDTTTPEQGPSPDGKAAAILSKEGRADGSESTTLDIPAVLAPIRAKREG